MAKKNLESDSSSSSVDESLPPPTITGMKPTVDSGCEFESDDLERPLRSIVSKQAEDGSKAKMPRSKANSKQAEDGSKAKRLRSKADSKQAEDGSEAKKPRSKAESKPSSSPSPTKMPAKRPTAAAGEKEPKKSKTVKASEAEEGKKSVLFQRLWSDDDEVAILEGMLEYKEQKGSDPMEDTNGFYEFVKSSVHCNMERRQLVDKLRRLKKRLENTKTRKSFSPHEMIVIELCKKVWGQKLESNTNTTSKASKNAATTKSAENAKLEEPALVKNRSCPTEPKSEAGKSSEGDDSVKFLGKASIAMGLNEAIVAAGLGLCSENQKVEIEKKWRKLHAEESDLVIKKLDLAHEESQMTRTEGFRSLGVCGSLQRLVKQEGIQSLYKGNGASVLRIVPYAALHFMTYEQYRSWLLINCPSLGTGPVVDLLAGSASGGTAVLCTYPLDLVRAKLAYQVVDKRPTFANNVSSPYNGIQDAFKRVYREGGIRGLYRGVGPTLVGILPYAGLKFYIYEELKRSVPEEHQKSIILRLSCGALAGLFGQTFTYPLDVVRRQMQVESLQPGHGGSRNTIEGLTTIVGNQGWRQLFAGLSINYIKVVPSVAIGFTTYDLMKSWLHISNQHKSKAVSS